MTPLLTLDKLTFSPGNDAVSLLESVCLTLHAGECHCITGATGAGKSSLLLLAAGLLGEITAGQRMLAPGALCALVLQDPHTQLLRRTIGAEVAFVLENLGVAPGQMPARVLQALRRVGLELPLNTRVDSLSLGQKYRLMIAAQLVGKPSVLMLDEPWAQLDDEGVSELLKLLLRLKSEGLGLLLVEHHAGAFEGLIDHHWHLHQGQLYAAGMLIDEHLPEVFSGWPDKPLHNPHAATCLRLESEPFSLMPVSAVSAATASDAIQERPLFSSPALRVAAAERVLLLGGNGSGKTSLLSLMAGCTAEQTVPLQILGRTPELGVHGADFCYLMQRPNRQLFELTVRAEMEYSLKRFKLPLERAQRMMALLDITHLADKSPHRLSYGQQHLVALGSLACLQPKLFLLDDPFAGLDRHYCNKVLLLLDKMQHEGCALIIASHRPLSLGQHQTWLIQAGKLEVSHVGQA
ncbi:ATP-binding cassette domain-containing protein [Shewanella sp. GXUN23E]|uniref:ATP-binding cassette domain-containing protein n=1 Tax=Shewanella sp. GXUN23E TaxID=3422498 RepID=UPI003D7E3B17